MLILRIISAKNFQNPTKKIQLCKIIFAINYTIVTIKKKTQVFIKPKPHAVSPCRFPPEQGAKTTPIIKLHNCKLLHSFFQYLFHKCNLLNMPQALPSRLIIFLYSIKTAIYIIFKN